MEPSCYGRNDNCSTALVPVLIKPTWLLAGHWNVVAAAGLLMDMSSSVCLFNHTSVHCCNYSTHNECATCLHQLPEAHQNHASIKRHFCQMLLPCFKNWPNFTRCPSCWPTWGKIIPTAQADKQECQTLVSQSLRSCLHLISRPSVVQPPFPRSHPASSQTWSHQLNLFNHRGDEE